MNEMVRSTCDSILENRNALKRSMLWEVDSDTYAIMSAILLAAKGMPADAEEYKVCKKTLRKNVNAFSSIRGYVEAVVATKMMTQKGDREEYIQGLQEVYKKLRNLHKLTASSYMVMAAMNIYESKGVSGADDEIDKLERLYKGLKEKHPLMTTDSDRGYLSMLVEAGVDVDQAPEVIERNYEALKGIYYDKDAVYTLAQVLALSDRTPEENREFVEKVLKGLKQNKRPISRAYGLSAVGALAMLGVDADQIVADILDAEAYWKGKKGFKWYNHGKRMRVTYAALAVFLSYASDSKLSDEISSNITVTIAQEIVLMMIIMMSNARVAASSSSSN